MGGEHRHHRQGNPVHPGHRQSAPATLLEGDRSPAHEQEHNEDTESQWRPDNERMVHAGSVAGVLDQHEGGARTTTAATYCPDGPRTSLGRCAAARAAPEHHSRGHDPRREGRRLASRAVDEASAASRTPSRRRRLMTLEAKRQLRREGRASEPRHMLRCQKRPEFIGGGHRGPLRIWISRTSARCARPRPPSSRGTPRSRPRACLGG